MGCMCETGFFNGKTVCFGNAAVDDSDDGSQEIHKQSL